MRIVLRNKYELEIIFYNILKKLIIVIYYKNEKNMYET